MNTLIHYVVMKSRAEPIIEQLTGVKVNQQFGAVTPVKAVAGEQDFACSLSMRQYAGTNYEGAHHAGTGEAQFVTCPLCKQTKAYKDDLDEHNRHVETDRGLFSGIFNKQVPVMQGGTSRPVESAPVADAAPAPHIFDDVLSLGGTGQSIPAPG